MKKMGRPSNGKSSFISFRLTEEMDKKIVEYAEEYGMSKSQVIVLALKKFFGGNTK